MLDARADIALVRTTTALASSKVFSECLPLQTGAYVSGAGVYLLTIAPAQTTEGRATTNGMNSALTTCNSDTIVNAVQFRLIQLDPPITNAELQDKNHLRNLIAYKCFGIDETAASIADPFGPEVKQWGLLDSLRPNQLTDCEVPLAVLYWTDDGINFIDMWSVRRRLARRFPVGPYAPLHDERTAAEGEAMFLQFQDQVGDLFQPGNPESVKAADFFVNLPAAGIIPVSTGMSTSGFDYRKFFADQTYREPRFIEGARFQHLLRQSFSYSPLTLGDGEAICLYQVRENMQMIAEGPGAPQPFLIFTSGHMPFYGDAHFDLSRFDYSNYSSGYE
jgi:hypothetical protein